MVVRPWHLPWVLSIFPTMGCNMLWHTDSTDSTASEPDQSYCTGACTSAAPVPFSRVVIMQFGPAKTFQECPDDYSLQGFSGCVLCPGINSSQSTQARASSNNDPSPVSAAPPQIASECLVPTPTDNGCNPGEVCLPILEDGFSACLFAAGTLPVSACPVDYPDHILTFHTSRNTNGTPECRCDAADSQPSTPTDTFTVTFCCQPAIQPPK
ncbi:MAG: hypothetical protein IPK82_06540 [Polyangiaceae bacterium]|nr:hypothetical protein [Polyangiaceae bacterium]